MTKKIQKIRIDHNNLGDIEIHNGLPNEENNLIGTIADDYSKFCFYFAKINLNENETITISQLNVIKPEAVNTGLITKGSISKNYVNIYKNLRVNTEIVCYPKSIISVFYENDF